jgi:hypothetical protein
MKLYTFAKKVLEEQLALGEQGDQEYIREARAAIWQFESQSIVVFKQVNGAGSNIHLRHCFQGEYEDSCKYGDGDDCPAQP